MSSQIITITLSPCIDKSTIVERFVPEKKLKCSYPVLEAGGGGINVSRVLKNFKTNSECIYISGGYTGKILDNLVFHEGLNAKTISSEQYTRENFIVFEKHTHLQFRFGMPINKVVEKEWRAVLNQIKKSKKSSFLVLSGSVSENISPVFFKEIELFVKKTNCKFIVDTAGSALKKIITAGAFLIKPNLNEFSGLYGTKTLNYKELVKKAKQMVAKAKVENVLVSIGKDGAILVNKTGGYHLIPPKVKVKSTVGAGDSMVAGIIYNLNKGIEILDAVKLGVAAGSATTANSGMQLCSLTEAKKLLPKVKIKKLL